MLVGILKRPNTNDSLVCRNYLTGLIDNILGRSREHVVVIPDDPDMIAFVREFYSHITPTRLRIMSHIAMRELCHVAIVVGGDGTMIQAMKHLHGVPTVGVNMGYLGFITDIPITFQVGALMDMLESEQYRVEPRTMLTAQIDEQPEVVALNDVALTRNDGRVVTFNVTVNGEFAYKMRGDGVLISTPTGSTAYALAAGGAIIDPAAPVIEVVPLLPQTMSHRPLILKEDSLVSVRVVTGRAETFVDGVPHGEIVGSDSACKTVRISKSPHKALIIHPQLPELGYSYFATLRTKLNWQFVPGTTS